MHSCFESNVEYDFFHTHKKKQEVHRIPGSTSSHSVWTSSTASPEEVNIYDELLYIWCCVGYSNKLVESIYAIYGKTRRDGCVCGLMVLQSLSWGTLLGSVQWMHVLGTRQHE